MNYASIVRVLALLMLIIAGSALLPIAVAIVAQETDQTIALLVMAIGISVLASSVLLLTPKPSRKARPSDALGVVIIWWFLAPLASALPFVVGVADGSLLHAIHEAAACLTTSGQSVIRTEGNVWPASLIVWRGVLHVLGGLATIVTAASVLGIHRTVLFTVPESSFFDAVPRVARSVSMMMLVFLIVLLGLLIMSGVSFPRALSDAVSAVTTGAVDPNVVNRRALAPFPSIILGLGLITGALGLAVWLPLKDRKPRKALFDPETMTFLFLVAMFAIVVLPLGIGLTDAIAWSVSAMSTSGLIFSNGLARDAIPLPILVLPALIGGSAQSAAGGVKVARLIVLARRAGQEFRQLGYRRSVLGFRFRDRELDERSVIGVWVYLIAYIVAVFIVMIGFSFLNLPFEETIRLSIGGLTNSGSLLLGHTNDLGGGATTLLIVSMILGRLEILAIIPALSPSFWRG